MIEQLVIKSVGSSTSGVINVSAGTTSNNLSNLVFSNSNGVSFGLNGSTITASISVTGGGGGAGTGFTTATTAGTNIVGTLSTNGLSMGVPAYLTTAMQSNASTISNINISAGTTSSNVSAVTFSNAHNVSFGYDGTNVTASIATTYAGTGFTTATTAGTNMVGTLNTSGLSMGVPAYLTTAMQSNAVTISNINISAGTTSTNASAFTFSNSNGLSFGLGTGANAGIITGSYTVPTVTNSAWTASDSATSLTIAQLAFTNSNGVSLSLLTTTGGSATLRASVATSLTNINVSAGTTSTNASAFTFSNANNVSFGLGTGASAGNITASIATTYAGTGFTTTTTAGTAIVGTLNTSGLSMGVPAFITTAEQSRQFLSYYANLPFYPNVSLPTTSADSNTFLVFPLTIQEKISIGYLRLIAFGAGTSTSVATTAVNNATGASTAFSETIAFNAVLYTVGAGANSRSLQYVYSSSAGVTWAVSVSQASTSNASNQTITQAITFPREGATTGNTSTVYNTSQTNGPIVTTWQGNLQGNLYFDIPFSTSLSAGNYWMAVNRMTGTVGGKNMDMNFKTYGVNQTNVSFAAMNLVSNVSNCAFQIGLGSWTTNAAQTTSSIAFASISASTSYFLPYVQFVNQS